MTLAAALPPIIPEHCPTLLRQKNNWLVWRYEHIAGEKKPRKIPYYCNGKRRFGVQGSKSDRAQLSSFDDACAVAKTGGYSGVGIAMLDGDITALDFDNCVASSGVIIGAIENLLIGHYAEISPSGKGVRAFVVGNLGNAKNHGDSDLVDGIGFECFATKGFVTFTGRITDLTDLTSCENTIIEPSAIVKDYCAYRFGNVPVLSAGSTSAAADAPMGCSEAELLNYLAVLDSSCGHDDWLKIGMALHHETNGDGFQLWDDWSSTSEKYAGRDILETRWHSFGQSDCRPVTIQSLLALARESGLPREHDPAIAQVSDFEDLGESDPDFPFSENDFNSKTGKKSRSFNIRSIADFSAQVKPLSWLIKGLLPQAQLAVMYGESGSGKSFLAFDMCCALARGIDWNGKKTKKAKILYVVAEGVGGFAQRVHAYCKHHGISTSDLDIDILSDVTPNLTDNESVNALMRDIHNAGGYDLVVLDTFAQCTAGADENSGKDVGLALDRIKRISAVAKGMTLVIHHSGKDSSKGMRGFSGIHAACDCVLEVTRSGEHRAVKVTKLKDGRDGGDFGFALNDVLLGHDEDGDGITSCVVDYVEKPAESGKPAETAKGAHEQRVLQTAHDVIKDDQGVAHAKLIDLVTTITPPTGGKRDRRKELVMRAIEALASKGLLVIDDMYVKLPLVEDT